MLSDRDNILTDRAEDRMAVRIQHLDFDRIASAHERCLGRAVVDRLDHPDFGDAAIAQATFADRFAGVAVGALVGDGAGTDDRAGGQRSCLGGMSDQIGDAEGGVLAGVGAAKWFAVIVDL